MRNPFRDRPAHAPAPERRTLRTRLNRVYRVAAAVVIGSVAFSGLYYLSQQSDTALSSLNPMTLFVPDQGRVALPESVAELPVVWAAPRPISAEEVRDMHLEYFPTGHTEALYNRESQLTAPSGEITWEEFPAASGEQAGEETDNLAWGEQPTADTPAEAESPVAPVAASKPEPVMEATKTEEKATAPEVKKTETPAKKLNKVSPAAPAKQAATGLVKEATGKFYVIGGGFSSLAKAKEIQANLKKTGLDPKIILPTGKGQLHRVSLADFDNRETAVEAMKIFKSKHGSSIWILTY